MEENGLATRCVLGGWQTELIVSSLRSVAVVVIGIAGFSLLLFAAMSFGNAMPGAEPERIFTVDTRARPRAAP
jgi:hypothetical protein